MVVLTGVGTVSEAVEAMKAGAYDFIRSRSSPSSSYSSSGGRSSTARWSPRSGISGAPSRTSAAHRTWWALPMRFEAVRALVAQVAPTDATVLITGKAARGKSSSRRRYTRRASAGSETWSE